jgi:hypothetical protein
MVDLQAISNATILEGLGVADLEKLGGVARERRVAHGEQLFARGQDADTLYIVLDGCFSLTVVLRVMGEGVETAIEELGTGDALGWSLFRLVHRGRQGGGLLQRRAGGAHGCGPGSRPPLHAQRGGAHR